MKTYLAYKNQTQGLKDVSGTVKTVEKIAASSVHFLKQEVASLRLYTAEIEKILARLSLYYQKKSHPLLQKNNRKNAMLVVLTGDKGLVGGLWHMITGAFLTNTAQYHSVVIIGSKGERYFSEEGVRIEKSFTQISTIPKIDEVEAVSNYIFDAFKTGKFSRVDILYPRFVSLAEQQPSLVSLLPFEFTLGADGKQRKEEKKEILGLPIFEPSKGKVFSRLLQKYIATFFYEIFMEARLSEFSARTVAMEQATAKTEKLIRRLTLDYAKKRRRTVTQKQLESFTVHKQSNTQGAVTAREVVIKESRGAR